MNKKQTEVVQTLQEVFGPNYQAIGNFGLKWMLRANRQRASIAKSYELLRNIGLGDVQIVDNVTLLGLSEDAIRKSHEFLKRAGLTKKEITASPQLLELNLERLERNYQNLCRIGLGVKITRHHNLLYRNPQTIESNYQSLKNKGLREEKTLANASLLASNPQTIEKHWNHLRTKGLTDEKIATNPHLLQMSPKTTNRNYQNLRRFFERDTIATFAPLLGIPPETVSSNVQFLNSLGIDPRRYPLASLSGPREKRKKIAWLVRQLFEPETRDNKEAIEKARRLVRENPKILVYSTATLERMRGKLRTKVWEF